jgi:hypothetical protein
MIIRVQLADYDRLVRFCVNDRAASTMLPWELRTGPAGEHFRHLIYEMDKYLGHFGSMVNDRHSEMAPMVRLAPGPLRGTVGLDGTDLASLAPPSIGDLRPLDLSFR